jgi:type IV pilus assembly protein PilA
MGNRSSQAGFTFIELMSVVVIIGILSAVALPNIKNYSARAKVSEAILALTSCRSTVQEVYLSGGNDLPAFGEWGCEKGSLVGTGPVSKFVDAIYVQPGGIIVVTLGPGVGDGRIANHDVSMRPIHRAGHAMDENDLGEGVHRWRCGLSTDGTDVDQTFLPSTCRGY